MVWLILAAVFAACAYSQGIPRAVISTMCVFVTGWFGLVVRARFIDIGFNAAEPGRRAILVALALLGVVLMGAAMAGIGALAAHRMFLR